MANTSTKAATKSSSFIERLAPELHLRILSHLPTVTAILKCRQISGYMRRLIDLEENQVIAAELIISSKRRELESVISLVCDYEIDASDNDGNPCGFLNALVEFNKYRGLSRDFCVDYFMLHKMFVEHWWTKHPDSQKQGVASRKDAFTALFDAILQMHSVHTMHHINKKIPMGAVATWTEYLTRPEAMSAMRLSSTKHVDLIYERIAAGVFSASAPFEESCEYAICHHYNAPKEWLQIKGSQKGLRLELAKRRPSTQLGLPNEERDENATAHVRAVDRARSGQGKAMQSANRLAIFEQYEEIEYEEYNPDTQHGAYDSEDEDSIEVLLSDKAWILQEGEEWLSDQFRVIFGVPGLPSTLPFAYFAKTQWAYNSIVDAAMAIKHLTPLEQAAVLEDMAIF